MEMSVEYLNNLFLALLNVDIQTLKYVAIGIVGFWVLLEIAFFVLLEFVLIPGLQKKQKPLPIEPCPVQFIKKILNVLDSMQTYDIRKYVEGFFHFTDLDEIHRDNMSSFLSWAMFGKESNLLNPKESEQLAEINAHLDDRYSELRNLKPGFNPKVSHCNFSLEPISYIHRPLFFYIAAGISESCFNLFFFRLRGYQSLEMDGLSYWIKQGSQNDSLPPLLIFHGISPGWSMYGMMIKYLDSHRTVILIDFDSIKIKSMKFYMPTINRFAATISKLLHRHQIKKVSLIGHSFGTILSGWLVNHIPENIAHVTLIDPVSLLLAFPDVAYSFLYKKPKTIWEWVIYLAASKEITVAYALHRNFCWHRNILWLEDVPEHIGVVVGIGSADEIADMKAVGEYVRLCSNQRKQKNARAEITCVEWPDYHHGQIMVSSQKLSHFLSVIKSSENLIE